MLKFPIKTINSINNHLLKQQEEIDKNLKEMEEDDPAKLNDIPESSEPGTDSYIADTHTKAMVFEQQLQKTSESIKTALLKIKNGIYGKCEKCGKQIEIARLIVIPTAQYCLSDSKKTSK